MTDKLIPIHAINFLHIYLYNVLMTATALGFVNVTAENGAWVVVTIGLISGIGITVLEEQKQILSQRLISMREAGWYALIAPFQILIKVINWNKSDRKKT